MTSNIALYSLLPWTAITAPAPDCYRCTWVWHNGQFALKYASGACHHQTSSKGNQQ